MSGVTSLDRGESSLCVRLQRIFRHERIQLSEHAAIGVDGRGRAQAPGADSLARTSESGRTVLVDRRTRCDLSLLALGMFAPSSRLNRPHTLQERRWLSGDANHNEDQCRAETRQCDKAPGNGRGVLRMRFGQNVSGSDVQKKPGKEAQIEHQHRPGDLDK
jgi:hypothetical protein